MEVTDRKRGIVKNIDLIAVAEELHGVLDDIDTTKEKEKEVDPVEDFGLEGEDETGRNAAYDCFQKIEKQILKAFKLLGNDEDRELFYDYLLTNVKLYFDQFEKDLQKVLGEPTTDEYEQEKDSLEATDIDAGLEEPIEGEEEMRAAQ